MINMKQKITFEEALNKLEEKVRLLEGGNITLDESLAAFEDAVGIVKICNERLEAAEGRVRLLVESADGSVSDTDFVPGDEA